MADVGNLLNPEMAWRGYNHPDPKNTYEVTTAGEALTVAFTQAVNRIIVFNSSARILYVKFGGVAASDTEYDQVLPPLMGMAAGINTTAISVYSAYAVQVFIGGYGEDNNYE